MNGPPAAEARWTRPDAAGTDACVLRRDGAGWRLDGEARFAGEGGRWRLAYGVRCDAGFATLGALVEGDCDGRAVAWRIAARHGIWRLGGVPQAAVAGLVDLDLAFTPATNLIALRRLDFPLGREVAAPAAWLAFPEMRLMPLKQFYARLSDDTLRYRAPAQGYEADLRVHPSGFVTDYPGLWQGEARHV